MGALLDRLGVEVAIVQAGMGGGAAGGELAAAVSGAGGLGTIGFGSPGWLREQLATARTLTKRPVAANLLLPFARSGHWLAAQGADAIVTFWGRPRRRHDGIWIHQCGSVAEALEAERAGADGVIAQGVEAGGHVRGTEQALDLLVQVREALSPGFPVWLAGGIAERSDVAGALAAGADGAVLGTRFLLSEESPAHDGYKRRLVHARETVLTELFGLGWPAPHRVVANAATERWLRRNSRGPAGVRALNRLTAPLASRLPTSLAMRMAGAQRPGVPLLGPALPLRGQPDSIVDACALYAGETVARIDAVRPAAQLVAELTP